VYELESEVEESLRAGMTGAVKEEEEEDVKPFWRAGGGAVVARKPLVRDVLNSL
jgi:hypothetical protein